MDADKAYEDKLVALERARLAAFQSNKAFATSELDALPSRKVMRTHVLPQTPPSAALIYFSDLPFDTAAEDKYCSAMTTALPKRSTDTSTGKRTLPYITLQVEVADQVAPGSQAVMLEIHHCYATETEAQLADVWPLGSLLSIKSPFLTLSSCQQSRVLYVDHPSSIETQLNNDSEDAEAAKQIGNQAFRIKRYHSALRAWQSVRTKDQTMQLSLWLNVAAVLIELQRFEEAVSYCDKVLAINKLSAKARYRKAVALYGSREFGNPYLQAFVRDEGMQLKETTPTAMRELLTRLKQRLKESLGHFDAQDWQRLIDDGKKSRRLDCADYTSSYIERRESNDAGIGLFAKSGIQAGDLIMVTKAEEIQLPSEARLQEVPIVDLVDGTVQLNQSPDLLDRLLQSASNSDTRRKRLSELYAGPEYDRTLPEKLTAHRVRKVLQYNAFDMEDAEVELPSLGTRRDTRPPEDGSRGFWYLPSYFNHSCLNNCSRLFVGDIMVIKANRDIAKDEEMTLGYVHRLKPFEARQEAFRDFGFHCACALCKLDMDERSQFPEAVKERQALLDSWRSRTPTLQGDLRKIVQETELSLEAVRKTYDKTRRELYHFDMVVLLDALVSSHKALGQLSDAGKYARLMHDLSYGISDDYALGTAFQVMQIKDAMPIELPNIEEMILAFVESLQGMNVSVARAWRCRGLMDGLPGFIRAFRAYLPEDKLAGQSRLLFGLVRGFLLHEQERKRQILEMTELDMSDL